MKIKISEEIAKKLYPKAFAGFYPANFSDSKTAYFYYLGWKNFALMTKWCGCTFVWNHDETNWKHYCRGELYDCI